MTDARIFEVIVKKCSKCPKCRFRVNLISNHYCELTEERLNLDKIGSKCPLRKATIEEINSLT